MPGGEDEDPFVAVKGEFQEETGFTGNGRSIALGSIKQMSGNIVTRVGFRG
jgi:predicted NUDIX family NTP pyrophosphohydrolase